MDVAVTEVPIRSNERDVLAVLGARLPSLARVVHFKAGLGELFLGLRHNIVHMVERKRDVVFIHDAVRGHRGRHLLAEPPQGGGLDAVLRDDPVRDAARGEGLLQEALELLGIMRRV